MGLLNTKKEIGDETILRRNSEMLFNDIDGEVVMLSIENGEYYGLDKVGSRIWQILENPIIYRELILLLMRFYEVSEEQCRRETLYFINRMLKKNLISIHDDFNIL